MCKKDCESQQAGPCQENPPPRALQAVLRRPAQGHRGVHRQPPQPAAPRNLHLPQQTHHHGGAEAGGFAVPGDPGEGRPERRPAQQQPLLQPPQEPGPGHQERGPQISQRRGHQGAVGADGGAGQVHPAVQSHDGLRDPGSAPFDTSLHSEFPLGIRWVLEHC